VRQIKQLNEPIEVKITEWNTGGLLTRIEVAEFFVLILRIYILLTT
jgi:small subunit ribosomal protein S1